MQATDFIEKSKDYEAWRKRARILRRSADVLWGEFSIVLATSTSKYKDGDGGEAISDAVQFFETVKLLYGLSLETALKSWIVKSKPDKMELRLIVDGEGEAVHAELKTIGVPSSQGHNILALAEVAGVFSSEFQHVLKTDGDRGAMRNICRDLGEIVIWRGRYPVPLASYSPIVLDPNVPSVAVAHYIRDWLDPMLDALLEQE